MHDLAIIILNYNGSEDTIECLESLDLVKTKYDYKVFLLDNGSRRESFEVIDEYIKRRADYSICRCNDFSDEYIDNNCLIISEENLGFAGGNNIIVNKIVESYQFILLLNNDTVVSDDFIEIMLDYLYLDKAVGFASCKINNYYDRSLLWNCGGKLNKWGLRRYYSAKWLEKAGEIIDAQFITGCALFVRKEIIEKYGFLTNDFFHGEEDFNFCWRMKENDIVGRCINKTLVFHKVSASSSKAGVELGKRVGYYANRIVDMKKFFSKSKWLIWKKILLFLLSIKWILIGIPISKIVKMVKVLERVSKENQIGKDLTLNIWNMSF